ncbi:MAG: hypothetical protein JXR96_19645 [Deltaproteobacteria bacterium]|nr:hypothetical protein [Deltaproteobacteria bacterium]
MLLRALLSPALLLVLVTVMTSGSCADGKADGSTDGSADGSADGSTDASADGSADGGADGVADEGCIPDCEGRQCGDDGCWGECGRCEVGSECIQGQCVQLHRLEVLLEGEGLGSVSGAGGRIDCPALCEAELSDGSRVTLRAEPDEGSCFQGWSGACSGQGADCSLLMSGDASCTAGFSIPQTWTKSYGGQQGGDLDYQVGRGGCPARDGGYAVAATAYVQGGQYYDFWVFELSAAGEVEWSKTFGGESNDEPAVIRQSSAGGYVVAGSTESFGLGVLNKADAWVIRLDEHGELIWQKAYGVEGRDQLCDLCELADGSLVLVGYSWPDQSPDIYDFWLWRIDAAGELVWDWRWGGDGSDFLLSVRPTSDGGFVLGGYTDSFGASERQGDFWVQKLSASGTSLWQKMYGGNQYEARCTVREAADGDLVVGGLSTSPISNHSASWVFGLDSQGEVSWQYAFPGDLASFVTAADGLALVGSMYGSDGEVFGGSDLWVARLDGELGLRWRRRFGGEENESAASLLPAPDGGFLAVGASRSFGSGSFDVWAVKLDGSGSAACGPDVVEDAPVERVETAIQVFPAEISMADAGSVVTPTHAVAVDMPVVIGTQCSRD